MSPYPADTGFLRHAVTCTTVTLPGDRVRFLIGPQPVGWLRRSLIGSIQAFPAIRTGTDHVVLTDGAMLPAIARTLAMAGHFRWRNEAFDVRAANDGPVLTTIDRGAIPAFGVQAVGVHLNGLVRRPDGLHVWIGRRAMTKLLDPGKLDHVVAGGVPAGLSPLETLIKEAGEEAAIPPPLAASARLVGESTYAMDRPEGLRRDRLFCYDLDLPADFTPIATDGEVESFELWPIGRVVETVRDTSDFKFNVSLVLIDLFIRLGLLPPEDATAFRARMAGAVT